MKAPPDAPRPRHEAEGDSTNLRGSGISTKSTTRPPVVTPLELFADTQLVLHHDPAWAAGLLVDELGQDAASEWATELVIAVAMEPAQRRRR